MIIKLHIATVQTVYKYNEMLAKTILTTLHSKATSYTENQYKFIYSISCLTLLFLSNIMYLFNQGSIRTFNKFFS